MLVSALLLASCTGTWSRDDGNASCRDEPRPGGHALRRLTAVEYRNTVRDLFPGVTIPTLTLTRDGTSTELDRFENDARGQPVSALRIEEYHRAAESVAGAAVGSLASWAPCTSDDDECIGQIATSLGARAQRRPLTTEDREALVALARTTRAELGFQEAVAVLIEALLQSPQFLYRPELGTSDGAPSGLARLDDHELASRLSYFLWRTMPDTELFRAADAGELVEPTRLEAQARRMLDDPRALETLADLHAQWFQLGRVEALSLQPELYPEMSAELREDIRRSAELYFEEVFQQGPGGFQSLFAGRFAYVNDRLAPVMGVQAPGGSELVRVELDADQRAGILTHPAFLAQRSKPTVHSPIFRGVFLLNHVLCSPVRPPPPGADSMTTPLPEGTVLTTRQRTVRTHSGVAICASCHNRIDGAGFAFERYDALGRYQTQEFGLPVDSRVNLPEAGDVTGSYEDAVELADRLAESRTVRECVATHYLRYALGREETTGDRCQIDALADALQASGGDLRELVVAIVRSPSFRHRTTGESP
jgi:hypothetical protein